MSMREHTQQDSDLNMARWERKYIRLRSLRHQKKAAHKAARREARRALREA